MSCCCWVMCAMSFLTSASACFSCSSFSPMTSLYWVIRSEAAPARSWFYMFSKFDLTCLRTSSWFSSDEKWFAIWSMNSWFQLIVFMKLRITFELFICESRPFAASIPMAFSEIFLNLVHSFWYSLISSFYSSNFVDLIFRFKSNISSFLLARSSFNSQTYFFILRRLYGPFSRKFCWK